MESSFVYQGYLKGTQVRAYLVGFCLEVIGKGKQHHGGPNKHQEGYLIFPTFVPAYCTDIQT